MSDFEEATRLAESELSPKVDENVAIIKASLDTDGEPWGTGACLTNTVGHAFKISQGMASLNTKSSEWSDP